MKEIMVDKSLPPKELVLTIAEEFHDDPELMAELIAFSSRFYMYSINNQRLIFSQNPNATFVQSYVKWKSDGYPVKRGEQGLCIVVPFLKKYAVVNGEEIPIGQIKDLQLKKSIKEGKYAVKERLAGYGYSYVFDISQTTCPTSEYPKFFSMGFEDDQYDQISKAIEDYTKNCLETEVSYMDFHSISLRGANLVGKHQILLNDKLQGAERLSTLLHEISHQIMHQTRDSTNINQIEFEADALSIMLQSYFDLPVTDTRKRHIAEHYQGMVNRLRIQYRDTIVLGQEIDKILDFPHQKMKEEIEKIRPYIEKCLPALKPENPQVEKQNKWQLSNKLLI